MKKIYLAIAAAVTLFGTLSAQVTNTITAPSTSSANATSSNRGPNGTSGHTTMRGVFLVPSSELTALTSTINSFGFVLTQGVGSAASGSLTVYLMNTAATTYTFGTNWTTATTGMTQVYTGAYNIPATTTPTVADFSFPSSFSYSLGSSVLVAYEYTGAVFSNTAAIYTCYNNGTTWGASAATPSITPTNTLTTTAFRPLYRFGTPNTFTNEIIVSNFMAAGITSSLAGAGPVSVDITNGSNTALTNIGVGLGVTGANPATLTTVVPALAAGQTTNVTFAYNPTTFGISNMTVAVAADQNPSNNFAMWTQSVTCNKQAINPSAGSYTNAIGSNTSAIIIASNLKTANNSTLSAAVIGISSNSASAGNSVYSVLLNSTGSIIATSQTIALTSGMLGTQVQFSFSPSPSITAGTVYYLGLAQPANTVTGYYPFASLTSANAPVGYITAPISGGSVANLTQNLGYFDIEAVFSGSCGVSVGLQHATTVANSINVYPNPTVNGKTTIAGLEGASVITVYNMLGQVVSSQSTDKEAVTIDLSNHMSGNYIIRVTNADNQSKTVKIINN